MDEDRDTTEIPVIFPDELAGGAYCNHMVVAHTAEEFVMDFVMVVPPKGRLTARVVTSPGHMKRIVRALQENIERYEATHGKVEAAATPPGAGGIGLN